MDALRALDREARKHDSRRAPPRPSREKSYPIRGKDNLSAEPSQIGSEPNGNLGESPLDGEAPPPKSKPPIAHSGIGKSQGRLLAGRPAYPSCSTEDRTQERGLSGREIGPHHQGLGAWRDRATRPLTQWRLK